MDAFSYQPPKWIETATHSLQFGCPRCGQGGANAERVWINRAAPVTTANYRRKWQEFYLCECGQGWWAWSSDRPPAYKNSDS